MDISSNLPPISQDFVRPNLAETKRPATSSGIIQQNAVENLPGSASFGGIVSPNFNPNPNYQQQAQQPPGLVGLNINTSPHSPISPAGLAKLGLRGAALNGNPSLALAAFNPNRRSSLGLTAIDETGRIITPYTRPAMTPASPAVGLPPGGIGGPPGSAGGVKGQQAYRRDSDAAYGGLFAHSVDDVTNSPDQARRGSVGGPIFNNPFPHPGQHQQVLDPALLASQRLGSSGGLPPNGQAAGVRFMDGYNGHTGDGNFDGANGSRRASEPHFKHLAQEVHMSPTRSNFQHPHTAPIMGNEMGLSPPKSAASFGQSGYPNYPQNPTNAYPAPYSAGNQYNFAQDQRRRSVQSGAAGGQYYTNSPGPGSADISRRPSVVDSVHSGYGGPDGRQMNGFPASNPMMYPGGFPPDYRFGDAANQSRSSISSVAGGGNIGAYPSGNGYPDPTLNFPANVYAPDPRNNSYSTGSTRTSFADPHGGRNDSISDALRRGSITSSADQKAGESDAATGPAIKKRPRRKFDQIERLYLCGWEGCEKSYGTLNHLNAHVNMQKHGIKRKPEEFKEIRKAWRKRKKEEAKAAAEQAQQTGTMDPAIAENMAWEAEGKWLAH